MPRSPNPSQPWFAILCAAAGLLAVGCSRDAAPEPVVGEAHSADAPPAVVTTDATPQAAYARAVTLRRERDWPGFVAMLTPAAQREMLALGMMFSQGPEFDALREKHRLDLEEVTPDTAPADLWPHLPDAGPALAEFLTASAAAGGPMIDLPPIDDVSIETIDDTHAVARPKADADGQAYPLTRIDGRWSLDALTSGGGEMKGRVIESGMIEGGESGAASTEIELVRKLPGHGDNVHEVRYAPNGEYAVSVPGDKAARVWKMPEGTPLFQITGHRAIAITRDSGTIATAVGKKITLWNAETGQEIRSFEEPSDSDIVSLDFSPDGDSLAVGSWAATAIWRNVGTGSPRRDSLGGQGTAVEFSPDGGTLAVTTGDPTLVRYDARTNKKVREEKMPSSARVVTWSPDGNLIAILQDSGHEVALFEVASKKTLWTATADGWGNGLAFTPDGRFLASGTHHVLQLWDVQTGQTVLSRKADTHAMQHLDVSPDGKYVLTGGGEYSEMKDGKREWLSDGDHALRLWRLPERFVGTLPKTLAAADTPPPMAPTAIVKSAAKSSPAAGSPAASKADPPSGTGKPAVAAALTGTIGGKAFEPETVAYEYGRLKFVRGTGFFPDAAIEVILFDDAEELPGKRWSVKPNAGFGNPHIRLERKAAGRNVPDSENFMKGYSLDLKFGPATAGRTTGQIALSVPDKPGAKLEGTFTLRLDGEPLPLGAGAAMPAAGEGSSAKKPVAADPNAQPANVLVKFDMPDRQPRMISGGYIGQNAAGQWVANMAGTTLQVGGVGSATSLTFKPRNTSVGWDQANGLYARHTELPPGRYVFYVKIENTYTIWQAAEVKSGENKTLPLKIVPTKPGTVVVAAPGIKERTMLYLIPLTENSQPPLDPETPNGWHYLSELGAQAPLKGDEVTFAGLAPGTYRVHAGDRTDDVVVKAGESTRLELAAEN